MFQLIESLMACGGQSERSFPFAQIQELETENSELKQQLQNLEEQLMIAHTPPVGGLYRRQTSSEC